MLFALAAALSLTVGQVDRVLLPPDDLREAEVAREMWSGGDYVVPHLAGLPFVEKPPGFQAIVALAYTLAGRPSASAARCVSVAFALATLLAVWLLGRRTIGAEASALAVALLGLSSRFCRAAHAVLLDNALTSAMAFSLLFAWTALDAPDARGKQRSWAACAFSLGVAFLIKGFVGPALFAAGLVTYLAWTGRIRDVRPALHPLPIAAFLVPTLGWVVPFAERASPELLRAFFVDNHVGRALAGFASNVRPPYFYALDLWIAFAPASLALPFAAVSAFRERRSREGAAGIFLLAFAVGPLALLSLAQAKDSVYSLPVYPALALLVAGWCGRALQRGASSAHAGALGAVIVSASAGVVAIVATLWLGGSRHTMAATGFATVAMTVLAARRIRAGDPWTAYAVSACLFALGWTLWFSGPIAAREIEKRTIRGPVEAALGVAAERTVLLYLPSDGVRGAASFWRDRTAVEVLDPDVLVRRLLEQGDAVAMIQRSARDPIALQVREAAGRLHAELVEEITVRTGETKSLTIFHALPARPVVAPSILAPGSPVPPGP